MDPVIARRRARAAVAQFNKTVLRTRRITAIETKLVIRIVSRVLRNLAEEQEDRRRYERRFALQTYHARLYVN